MYFYYISGIGSLNGMSRVFTGRSNFLYTYVFKKRYKFTGRGLIGLTHSSASRRVAIIRNKTAREQKLKKQINTIKSEIKP